LKRSAWRVGRLYTEMHGGDTEGHGEDGERGLEDTGREAGFVLLSVNLCVFSVWLCVPVFCLMRRALWQTRAF
jgi:hypothetical protein